MSNIDKLLKFINSKNVAEYLDEEESKEFVQDVITGYQIDDDSRSQWLEVNKEAMKIIKNTEDIDSHGMKDFPFQGACKVMYSLISPAVIQLASRLIQHIVRNDVVAECKVLGPDTEPDVDIKTGQPTGYGKKEKRAKRVRDFLSYELLIESDSWLLDQHKMCHILASWGMAFKKVYYDPFLKKNCSELISPEDIIINQATPSLDRCRRITIRRYMTKNEIIEKQKANYFLDFDLDILDVHSTTAMDNVSKENDSREKQPIFEILEQFCYYDLDDDEYEEPYVVFVHPASETLIGMYTAFELKDLKIEPNEETGALEFLGIIPRHNIVDYRLIDDPEGKFYSLGLNALLLHQNKAITAILRQLIDAGILRNTAGTSGFITKAFTTKQKNIKFKLGQFEQVEINPSLRMQDQIMNLPFQEPSQVLLALLQFLVDSGKELGFMTDILTGDSQTQNVPATTTLAMIEMATRAFKPVVQKLFQSEKKEFKIWFHLHSLYLNKAQYFNFQDQSDQVIADDFNEDDLDIVPVADPTMSSEAHKYARLQAMMQFMQNIPGSTNVPEGTKRFYTELEFPNPDALVQPPSPPPPDPKLLEAQTKQQALEKDKVIDTLKQQLAAVKIQLDARKVTDKELLTQMKIEESSDKKAKLYSDAIANVSQAVTDHKRTEIEKFKAETDRIIANQPAPKSTGAN